MNAASTGWLAAARLHRQQRGAGREVPPQPATRQPAVQHDPKHYTKHYQLKANIIKIIIWNNKVYIQKTGYFLGLLMAPWAQLCCVWRGCGGEKFSDVYWFKWRLVLCAAGCQLRCPDPASQLALLNRDINYWTLFTHLRTNTNAYPYNIFKNIFFGKYIRYFLRMLSKWRNLKCLNKK